MKKTLFALCFCLLASLAHGATRYASPTGSGSACTVQATPCSLTTMVDQLVAGDIGILENGTYTLTVRLSFTNAGSLGSQITVKARNPKQATITTSTVFTNSMVWINKSYVTFQDIVIDPNATPTSGGSSCVKIGTASGTPLTGIVFERNVVKNCPGAGVTFSNLSNTTPVIVRWNEIDGTGMWTGADGAEPFYISGGDGTLHVDGLLIYGNRSNNSATNVIDYKDGAFNVIADHNIFEGHVLRADKGITQNADDGCVRTTSSTTTTNSNNQFNDNIVRNSKCDTGVYRVGGIHLDGDSNVFYGITVSSYFFRGFGNTSFPYVYSNGTHCSTPTGFDGSTNPALFTLTNNTFGAAQGTCDAEVTRILGELSGLAGYPPSVLTGPVVNSATTVDTTHTDITFTNDTFPPIKSPDYTKCTVEEDADGGGGGGYASRAVSAGAVQGTNVLRLTHAAYTGGAVGTMRVTCTAGAVKDSANYLSQDINLNSSDFTNQSVTNTLGGSPAYTFEQVEQRIEKVDGTEAAPVSLGTAPNIEVGASFKIRTWFRCNTADCPALGLVLKYSLEGGGYTAVPDTATADDIQFYGTTNVHGAVLSQGTATTQQISSGGFVSGSVVRTSNAIPTFDLASGESIELVHIITILTSATPTDQYCFQVADQAGIEAITYTQSRCVTLADYSSGL